MTSRNSPGSGVGEKVLEMRRFSESSVMGAFRLKEKSMMNGERLERIGGKWLVPLLAAAGLSVFLFVTATLAIYSRSSPRQRLGSSGLLNGWGGADGRQHILQDEPMSSTLLPDRPPPPPALAYLLSGSVGDGKRMVRLLKALYHPRNEYVLHLDLEAPPRERVSLARNISLEPMYIEVGNVHMISRANLVTYRGPTMISTTLHAMAILLRRRKDWDWFINLSASDYPLLPQDDILHVLSYIPRDLNFVEHTSNIGWKEYMRAKPIIMDPGIYSGKKADIFFATQRRTTPSTFKLFTGSAWVMLSRDFSEYCIQGYDNLPRLLLMYYTNFVSSPEGYFHTVICNAPEFRNTTVNHDLHFIPWDTPPQQHPRPLEMIHWKNLTKDGVLFARKFKATSPVLDRLDKDILHRRPGGFTPGGWCIGPTDDEGADPCRVRGDSTLLKPGPGSRLFQKLLLRVLSHDMFRKHQCE